MKQATILSLFIFGSAVALASDTQKYEETVKSPDGTTIERKVTIKGEVVSLDPGRTIVLRQPEGGQVTYQLRPDLALPADVKVGEVVVLATEPRGAATVVTHVTREVSPDGTTTTTEQKTTKDPLTGASRTETTKTYTVKSYEPSKSVTLIGPDGKAVSFELNAESQVPSDIVVGKTVTVETSNVGAKQIIRRVVVIEK